MKYIAPVLLMLVGLGLYVLELEAHTPDAVTQVPVPIATLTSRHKVDGVAVTVTTNQLSTESDKAHLTRHIGLVDHMTTEFTEEKE